MGIFALKTTGDEDDNGEDRPEPLADAGLEGDVALAEFQQSHGYREGDERADEDPFHKKEPASL